MRFASTILIALSFTSLAIAEDAPKNNTFETKLKSVSIFRDGFGYYVREGKVKLENGWATTNFIPQAIRGTVYVYTLDKDDKIDTVVTTPDNRIGFDSPKEIKTKLADKNGLMMTVTTKSGQAFEGVLSKTLDDMVLLQIGQAYSAVPYDQILTITLKGYPIKVKVDTKNPSKVVTIGIAYLQEGISWAPNYVLKIDGGKAELSLRAQLQNTTERLENSDVQFVVGSPFVANRGQMDMISMLTMPTSGGVFFGGGRGGGGFGGAMGGGQAAAPATESNFNKIDFKSYDPSDNSIVVRDRPTTIAEAEAGELYFYTKSGLSLSTGDIAMVSIFNSVLPVTPQFEWNADGDDVTYILSIKNTGTQPLTTGSVFVIEDNKAMGQSGIRYTPTGANAEIRLSQGFGLRVEKTDAEVKRGDPIKIGKSDFVPVTMKGTLLISNFRKEKATIKINKTVRGKMGEMSDGGKVKQTALAENDPNATNTLEWKLNVPASQTKEVTFTYEVYLKYNRE